MDLTFEEADVLARAWFGPYARAEEIITTFAPDHGGESVTIKGRRRVYYPSLRGQEWVPFERTKADGGPWR